MSRLITAKVPPTGWHYIQDGVRIQEDGLEQLVDAVIEHRIQNGKPVGNVIADVEQYLCSNFPAQCHPERGPVSNVVSPISHTRQTFIDSITQWSTAKSREQVNLVEPGKAHARSNICLGCPQNQPWGNGCPPCIKNAERLLTIVRGGKEVPNFQRLGGCQILKIDNRTSCWLEKIDPVPGLPDHCWVKRNT